jgi:hypothetical protein
MRRTPLTHSTKRIAVLLVAAVLAQSTPAAVRDDHVEYIGGTADIQRGVLTDEAASKGGGVLATEPSWSTPPLRPGPQEIDGSVGS